eukprot:TCONS_00060214-protein
MSQKTRSSTELAKMIEEILDNRLENLASKDDVAEIKGIFNKINENILYQDKKIASLEKDSVDHEERISFLEQNLLILQDKNAVLSSTVDFLTKKSDDQEQYSRRSCLRINGIEKRENESSADCVKKVIEVFKDMDVAIEPKDIDRAHRVGKERSTMIVKLYSFDKRTSIYKARKKAKNNIKIYLDLTKKRLKLLDEAKEFITKDCNVDFVFADINCNTVARLKSNQYNFFDNI